jgi:hypothetical protein
MNADVRVQTIVWVCLCLSRGSSFFDKEGSPVKTHLFTTLGGSLLVLVVMLAGFVPPAAAYTFLRGHVAFMTANGHYLTAVGAGNKTSDALHTDAMRVGGWERFSFVTPGSGSALAIRTDNGHYLTAVNGGGKTQDAIHTDAQNSLGAWEFFTLIDQGDGTYAIRTSGGRYLTAVGGGGFTTDSVHTDATQVSAWEKWRLIQMDDVVSGWQYAIQTYTSHYLTAVDGGGRTSEVMHQDATKIGKWEMFRFLAQGSDGTYGIQTTNGHYVTALGGGGKYLEDKLPDVLHTDATSVGGWEKWRPLGQPDGSFLLQTSVGKYLSVPNGKMHTAGDLIAPPDQFHLFVVGPLQGYGGRGYAAPLQPKHK